MKKDLIVLFALLLLAALLIPGIDIKSVDEYYLLHAEDVNPGDPTVTVLVDASAAVAAGGKTVDALLALGDLPADGILLSETTLVLREGDSAFGLFVRAARIHRLTVEHEGSEKSLSGVYVKGVNGLSEFSCGASSGWLFTVNGRIPETSPSAYYPSDGDVIEWRYETDLNEFFGS